MGVVYNPEHGRYVNYVPSILPERNDAFIFIYETNELHSINIGLMEIKYLKSILPVCKLKNKKKSLTVN